MTPKVWQIDEVTYLVQNDEGLFKIWWAGCYMGDWNSLERIVEEPLLTQCRELAATPPTHREADTSARGVEIGGYGEPMTMDFIDFQPIERSQS